MKQIQKCQSLYNRISSPIYDASWSSAAQLYSSILKTIHRTSMRTSHKSIMTSDHEFFSITNNLWLCPFCNKLLSAKGSLTQHVGSKHEGDETCRGEAMKTYLHNMDRWLCGPRLINNAALSDCITSSSHRGIPTTGGRSRHQTTHHQASPLPQPPPIMQTTPSLYKTQTYIHYGIIICPGRVQCSEEGYCMVTAIHFCCVPSHSTRSVAFVIHPRVRNGLTLER